LRQPAFTPRFSASKIQQKEKYCFWNVGKNNCLQFKKTIFWKNVALKITVLTLQMMYYFMLEVA